MPTYFARTAPEVRRAALSFTKESARRAPDDVTTTWWRRDRDPLHEGIDDAAFDLSQLLGWSDRDGVDLAESATP